MLKCRNGIKLTGFLPPVSLCPYFGETSDFAAYPGAEKAFNPNKSFLLSLFTKGSLLVALLAFTLFFPEVQAQTPPTGFSTVAVSSGWNQAVGLTFNQDGSKMFVWEKNGSVWVVVNNQKTLLIDISEEVGDWNDHGLLGFALHPQFEQNGYFYLLYIVDRHHLLYYGTSNYSATTNEYMKPTIGRVARYTATKTAGNYTVEKASRKILLGATKSTGFPVLATTHGVGSLVFGTDGTLLVSCGDIAGAIATGDMGGGSYSAQALADGILTPQEDVGSFRAQMLQSLNGKLLRIDADTGEGIPSNPFYEPTQPNSTRSKVWALGLRNPFRFTLQPETGSHFAADGNPGILYVGDVGSVTWEELDIVTKGGMNFGWPLFEGLDNQSTTLFTTSNTYNYYAPNPLYGVNGCTQQYFYFRDLITQVTASGTPRFSNPCNTSQSVPASIPTFVHCRPIIDWKHSGGGPARTGIFSGQTPAVINIGAAGSPISGPQFRGNASIGGVFYTGDDFPAQYKNTYFHGDYGGTWIKNLAVNASTHQPTAVKNFIDNGAIVVAMATNPVSGSLYYVNYGTEIRKVYFSANRPPMAVASVNKSYGVAPLAVQLSGNASSDPEAKPLSYEWNFGDGSAVSTQANPTHTFAAAAGVPTKFTVTLEVEDDQGNTDQTTLVVSANNTPPQVTITSPADNSLYPLTEDTTYPLRATVTDQEQSSSQLSYQWQTVLHHNEHTHPEPIDTVRQTTTTLSPLGCDGQTYSYRITLIVTDAAGLSTTKEVNLYPDCSTFIEDISNLSATASSQQVELSWLNPGSAFDEVLVVAKAGAPVTATPTGDGSGYAANLSFTAAATSFGGGKVVYKGLSSPETITSLSNNTTYFFKVFTRKGTTWSVGKEISAVPTSPQTGQQLGSFTLVNADTDQDLQTLANGASLNLATLPTKNLNIRANCSTAGTTPAKVGSVVFNLTGQQIRNYTEGGAPYSLFGDVNGNYNVWVPALGSYTLQGTPFSAGGGSGTAGTPLTINFTVINQAGTNQPPVVSNAIPSQTSTVGITYSFSFAANTFSDPEGSPLTYAASLSDNSALPAWLSFNGSTRTFSGTATTGSVSPISIKVTASDGQLQASTTFTLAIQPASTDQQLTSFTLVNADTDQDIQTLANGASLNLATLPTKNLNIRANCSTAGTTPAKVGSVLFNLSGQQIRNYTEGGAPYALFGDVNGNYNVWVPALGSYTLKGSPFSAGGGTGTLGSALTISFTVINQAGARTAVGESAAEQEVRLQLLAQPNPFSQRVFLTFSSPVEINTVLLLHDMQGRAVRSLFEGKLLAGEEKQLEVEAGSLPEGIYLLRLVSGRQTAYLKVVVVH